MPGFLRLAALATLAAAVMGGSASAQGHNFASQWVWWTGISQAACLAAAENALARANSWYGVSSGADRSEFDVRNTHGDAHIAIYCLADDHDYDDVVSAYADRILLGIDVSLTTLNADADTIRLTIEDCMFDPSCSGGVTSSASTAGGYDTDDFPLTWTDTAVGLRGDTGAIYDYYCPPEPYDSLAVIWGVDHYTDDSAICVAALHAGVIGSGGGQVSIQIYNGGDSFSGSTRNGVTSLTYGAWPGSYMFVY